MESEKVKEIKKALECCKQNEIEDTCEYCSNCPASDWDYETECNVELFQKVLTLINHQDFQISTFKVQVANLEKELKKEQINHLYYRQDSQFKGSRIAELENIGLNEEITVGEYLREMQRLKDRVAELEKEVEARKEEVLHLQEYGKKLIRETELKQFAERLKEITCEMYLKEQLHRCIDETLKEFINNQKYENNTTNIRLETLKEFREKYKEALKEAVKGENVNCFVESLKIFDKTIKEKICDLK